MISTLCAFYMQTILVTAEQEWHIDKASLLMAQMTQESACKTNARSAYAHGLFQFTPATVETMERSICKDLGPGNPYNEEWAIVCGIRYDVFLYNRMAEYSPEIERIAAMLASYNGGRGWVNRDNKVCSKLKWCDSSKWFNNVELSPDTRRAVWAIKENRGYPKRIIFTLLPIYEAEYGIHFK